MIDRATPATIRLAIAEAAEGTPSMLEASAKMPVLEAERIARRLVSADDPVVRYWTSGRWLHIAPAA